MNMHDALLILKAISNKIIYFVYVALFAYLDNYIIGQIDEVFISTICYIANFFESFF